jgi:hypothetical protein
MNDLLEKISSYNIFNFLLPGVVFSVLVSKMSSFNLVQEDVLSGAFVYYFFGAIVSRIGSLVVEPILKATNLVTFAAYRDYVLASKNDSKIEILSETNNMYRTMCALVLCVGVVCTIDAAMAHFDVIASVAPAGGLLFLFAIFAWSYRKQTSYITKRISANLDKSEK